MGDGEIADPHACVELGADHSELLLDPRLAAPRGGAANRGHAVEKVLGYREVVENRSVLIDNAETKSLRPCGRRLVKQLSPDLD